MSNFTSLFEKTATLLGGYASIAKVAGKSPQSIQQWKAKKTLPRTEWTAETHYAAAIEKATNGKVKASDLCPGAGQYMKFERIEKIDFSISKDVNNKTLITIKNFPGLDCDIYPNELENMIKQLQHIKRQAKTLVHRKPNKQEQER